MFSDSSMFSDLFITWCFLFRPCSLICALSQVLCSLCYSLSRIFLFCFRLYRQPRIRSNGRYSSDQGTVQTFVFIINSLLYIEVNGDEENGKTVWGTNASVRGWTFCKALNTFNIWIHVPQYCHTCVVTARDLSIRGFSFIMNTICFKKKKNFRFFFQFLNCLCIISFNNKTSLVK